MPFRLSERITSRSRTETDDMRFSSVAGRGREAYFSLPKGQAMMPPSITLTFL